MKPVSGLSRRRFIGAVPVAAGVSALALEHAAGQGGGAIFGKSGLRILSERPVNAETLVADLDPRYTPNDKHFVRNNGGLPERALSGSLEGWSLRIDGEVGNTLEFSLDDLQARFEIVSRALVLECAGNGRAAFQPGASGNQWWLGAVGCARYTGVRLRDVLDAAGVLDTAVYVAYYGEDPHLSGNPEEVPISRGVPLSKAMDESTLLAWEMNGEPLPPHHGFPLRVVAPGFPASASGKWLRRLWVRDQVHDGPKMTGYSYRVPRYPSRPEPTCPKRTWRSSVPCR